MRSPRRNAAPNSRIQNGFPPLCSTRSRRTVTGSRTSSRSARSVAAAVLSIAVTGTSRASSGGRRPGVSGGADAGVLAVRRVASRRRRSWARRDSAYSKAVMVARSIHGRSSIASRTGRSWHSSQSAAAVAVPTSCGPSWLPSGSRRTMATSSATRCAAGRRSSTSPATGSSRSVRPAKESPVSVWSPRAASTRHPASRASSTPADQTVDLPMPASPVSTTARGRSAGLAISSLIAASSAGRAMSIWCVFGWFMACTVFSGDGGWLRQCQAAQDRSGSSRRANSVRERTPSLR